MSKDREADSDELDDFPKRPRQHTLQTKSFRAFEHRLIDDFIVQGRDAEDYGTDLVLEALESSQATNFRVHVQMKATDAAPAADGSYVVRVNATNLNYLLSQPEAIYVLYSATEDALFYLRAEDISRAREHSAKAATITLRFASRFDTAAQVELHGRVLRTGRKLRALRVEWSHLPPVSVAVAIDQFERSLAPVIPASASDARRQLSHIHGAQREVSIVGTAAQYLRRFPDDQTIAALVHACVIDAASAGHLVPDELLEQAACFWEAEQESGRYAREEAAYNAANAHAALKRHERALALYEKCIEVNPSWSEARKNAAHALIELGKTAEAAQQLELAIKHDPFLFEARYSLATLARQRGEHAIARRHLEGIVLSELSVPQRATIYAWLARACSATDEHVRAIATGELAIECAPEEEWAWEAAAQAYSSGRRASPALAFRSAQFWRRFAERAPARAAVWAELAFSLWFLRDGADHRIEKEQVSRECLVAFEKCLALGHTDGGLIPDRIGHLREDAGDLLLAIEAYEAAASEDEKQFGYCLGCALMGASKYDRALPYLRASAVEHDRDSFAWKQLARCHAKMGKPGEALEAYQRAIELDPKDPAPMFEAGGLFWNDGLLDEAESLWKPAIVLHLYSDAARKAYDLMLLRRKIGDAKLLASRGVGAASPDDAAAPDDAADVPDHNAEES